MSNGSNYFNASVNGILQQSKVDYRIVKALEFAERRGNEILISDEYKDVLNAVKYLQAIPTFIPGDVPVRNEVRKYLSTALDKIMINVNLPVEFRQTMNPYIFKVSNGTFNVFLPLITTRALIALLKTFGVKCEAYKKNKALCIDSVVCLTELAYQGKSSIDISELKVVADACKAIKGRITPWYRDDEVIEEETSHLSEASARFRGADWFLEAQKNVSLIGAGGLGSNIAVSLCRVLGDKTLTIWDPDYVEHVNLAGQNFGLSDIGAYKAATVAQQCLNFNPELCTQIQNRRFSEDSYLSDVVITGLDNMITRKLVFSKWQGNEVTDVKVDFLNSKRLLIDARLSAEKWQIFCMTGDNKDAQKEYEDNWLFTDEEADSDVCTYKQTAYAAQMCASFVTNLYINFCTNLTKDKDDPTRRYLPFMIEYDASQMFIRTKEI